MLDVAAHMLLLQRQAKIKQERPTDASFLPLSLTVACLLRQLPAGLAPPSGMLSLHQIDRLPLDLLEQKLFRLLYGDDEREVTTHGSAAFDFLRSIVVYARTARALLAVCHGHLTDQLTNGEATQALIDVVVATLSTAEDAVEDQAEHQQGGDGESESPREWSGSGQDDPSRGQQSHPIDRKPRRQSGQRRPKKASARQKGGRLASATPATALLPPAPVTVLKPVLAVDPSGIMKRALARDVGDGSAVVQTMRKFPDDPRIQSHGVRALKSAIRKFTPIQSASNQRRARAAAQNSDSDDSGSEEDDDDRQGGTSALDPITATNEESELRQREVVRLVISSMQKYPANLSLQRDALVCLLEFASLADVHIAVITSFGGVVAIMEAMARLPDDEEAQIAALSVLGHPTLAEASVVRVNPESRRLVLSAMRRFPLSERLQGLACLALANLSLRQDESMREIVTSGGLELVLAAMNRFHDASLIQAAGSWLLATVSSKDDAMLAACLDAGGLPPCEKARVRFAADPRVQQHAVLAIQSMVRDVPETGGAQQPEGEREGAASLGSECCVQ